MDSTHTNLVRVAVAEDSARVRDAVVDLIRGEDGFELVGAVGNADDVVELVARAKPDVALVDVRMPGSGPAATRRIVAGSSGTRVVALSAHNGRAAVLDMLEAGAVGYVVKGTPVAGLLDAIRGAAAGEGSLSSAVTGMVIGELTSHLATVHDQEALKTARRARVRAAIADEGALAIVYQPICRLSDRSELAVEALSRFRASPVRPPDEWFAEAGTVGLRTELEFTAIERALARLGDLPPTTALSINISPESLLAGGLEELLAGVDSTRLIFEITEHTAITDYARFSAALATYRGDGVRIAVDDAGSGFASLRHILQLAPDVIKLDRSLTDRIEDDPCEQALARSLIGFAEQLGALVIAEGIEREGQLDMLAGLGVAGGQGYLLGRPAPLRDSRAA